jgi:hypothetical protein
VIKNKELYISKTGTLYLKFHDKKPGRGVYRLEPVWPLENELLAPDWFEREVAEGNIRLIVISEYLAKD